MNKRALKIILYIFIAWIILGIGILIGMSINKKINEEYPKMKLVPSKSWEIKAGDIAALTEDNYWKFVKQAYILVGRYPDYQYYKIVKEIPRNNFIQENFYIEEDDKMYYHDDDGNRKSTLVIDVSTYQANIDWESVKEAGVDMAIIRVGFRGYGQAGKILQDQRFEEHVEGALEAGLKVGVYFFSQAINYDEGVEEARFALDCIADYDIEGPVVIDTEGIYDEEARTYNLDIESRTDSVIAFCDTVEEAGYTPMIYANRNWFVQDLDLTRLGKYRLWVASYSNTLDFPYMISGWQYTGDGTIEGVNGPVDLNVWFDY